MIATAFRDPNLDAGEKVIYSAGTDKGSREAGLVLVHISAPPRTATGSGAPLALRRSLMRDGRRKFRMGLRA